MCCNWYLHGEKEGNIIMNTSVDAEHPGASLSEQNTTWIGNSSYTLNRNGESVVECSV